MMHNNSRTKCLSKTFHGTAQCSAHACGQQLAMEAHYAVQRSAAHILAIFQVMLVCGEN